MTHEEINTTWPNGEVDLAKEIIGFLSENAQGRSSAFCKTALLIAGEILLQVSSIDGTLLSVFD